MKKTRRNYEKKLNTELQPMTDLSSDVDLIFDEYQYLCSNVKLENAIHRGTVGTLIRRYDPILFSVGYKEWKR